MDKLTTREDSRIQDEQRGKWKVCALGTGRLSWMGRAPTGRFRLPFPELSSFLFPHTRVRQTDTLPDPEGDHLTDTEGDGLGDQ